jgi:hypothetical protein
LLGHRRDAPVRRLRPLRAQAHRLGPSRRHRAPGGAPSC